MELHRLQEFVRLHRLKTGCREVCRPLGMGRTTEWRYREVLAKAGLLEGDPTDLPTDAASCDHRRRDPGHPYLAA